MQKWEYKILQFIPQVQGNQVTGLTAYEDGQIVDQYPWMTMDLRTPGPQIFPKEYVEYLNYLGQSGWEMITNEGPSGTGHFYLFKRLKP
jgi:hypothetical protein